jgi:transcriptional regulator with XRE-family HTH domain
MNIREKFGLRIKSLRLERKLSQETFANLAELDRTYIPSIEKGERNVSIEVIQKISIALGMNISDLFIDI